VCVYRFQNVFLRCPTPRLHCFLSSHWPTFRFLSFMVFLIPSIQFFFGLPRAQRRREIRQHLRIVEYNSRALQFEPILVRIRRNKATQHKHGNWNRKVFHTVHCRILIPSQFQVNARYIFWHSKDRASWYILIINY